MAESPDESEEVENFNPHSNLRAVREGKCNLIVKLEKVEQSEK